MSLAERSMPRSRQEERRRSISWACAFSMEMCRGVLPSASCRNVTTFVSQSLNLFLSENNLCVDISPVLDEGGHDLLQPPLAA